MKTPQVLFFSLLFCTTADSCFLLYVSCCVYLNTLRVLKENPPSQMKCLLFCVRQRFGAIRSKNDSIQKRSLPRGRRDQISWTFYKSSKKRKTPLPHFFWFIFPPHFSSQQNVKYLLDLILLKCSFSCGCYFKIVSPDSSHCLCLTG